MRGYILSNVRHMQGIAGSAEACLACVDAACSQIRNSSALRRVLGLVLSTGNLMNAGSHRGNAQGVKLESLLKLADVKVATPGILGSDFRVCANGMEV